MPTKTRRRRKTKNPVGSRRMSTPSNEGNLIDDLESRQNDVLDRLADLNSRVEGLLNECLQARENRLQDAEASKPPVGPPKSAAGYAADPATADSSLAE